MLSEIYFNQAELLLKVLPIINEHNQFALKGGTAINFFIRYLPRISVDIDLTYIPLSNVKWKLQNLNNMSNDKHKIAYKKLEKHLENIKK